MAVVIMAYAADNPIWEYEINESEISNGWSSLEQLCDDVERMSAGIDPNGVGVSVIYYDDIPAWTNVKYSIYASNKCTLRDLIELPFSDPEYSVVFAKNVAIAGMKTRRTINQYIEGRCCDAITRQPLTNISLKWSHYEGRTSISTNGIYSCIMPVDIEFNVNSKIIFASKQFLKSNILIRVDAPGYMSTNCSVPVLLPENKLSYSLNIELFPQKGGRQ